MIEISPTSIKQSMSDDSDSDEEFDVYVSTRRPTPNPPVYAVPCFSNPIASLRELVPPPLQLHLLVEDNTAC